MAQRAMTYRVVPLESRDAALAPTADTIAERLAMVSELSRMAWLSSGRPFPTYTRSNMPVRFRPLRDQGGADDR